MNYLVRFLFFVTLAFPSAFTFAGGEHDAYVYGDEKNINGSYTREICQTIEYFRECEVWRCEQTESKTNCSLSEKYVCDKDSDCHDGHITGAAGINSFTYDQRVYELISYCWSVNDCNEVIAACISVGGEFVPGVHDPNTGAPKEGFCRL